MQNRNERELFSLMDKGDFASADALIGSGANVDGYEYTHWVMTDYGGEGYNEKLFSYYLPGAIAAMRLDIVDFLMAHGANFNKVAGAVIDSLAKSGTDFAFEALKVLADHLGNRLLYLDVKDTGDTLLHLISREKKQERRNSYEPVFSNPQQSATCFNFTLQQLEDLLGKFNLDTHVINSKNTQGDTPMHMAVRNGNMAMTQWLLQTGKVDLGIKDSKRQSVTMLAETAHPAIREAVRNAARIGTDTPGKVTQLANHSAALFTRRQGSQGDSILPAPARSM